MTARNFFTRKVLLAALAAVLVLWLGAGGYYLYTSRIAKTQKQVGETQQKATPQEEEASSPGTSADTTPKFTPTTRLSDWPVHQNTDFGYQISYPDGTAPRDQGAVGTEVLNLTNFIATDQGKTFPVVGVKVVATPYAQLETRMKGLAGAGYTVQEAPIAGVTGLRVAGKRSGDTKTIYEALFPSKSGEYTFRIITAIEPGQEAHLEVFDQMLESFSFL